MLCSQHSFVFCKSDVLLFFHHQDNVVSRTVCPIRCSKNVQHWSRCYYCETSKETPPWWETTSLLRPLFLKPCCSYFKVYEPQAKDHCPTETTFPETLLFISQSIWTPDQGPLRPLLLDFWGMVWKQGFHCTIIIFIRNLLVHLLNGLNAEVVEEVPLSARDSFLALVVGLADFDAAHQVAPYILLLNDVDKSIHFVKFSLFSLILGQWLLAVKKKAILVM